MRVLAKNKKCKVKGCEKLVGAHGSHGMCTRHARLEWAKRVNYRPPTISKSCDVHECSNLAVSNTSPYCAAHYYQVKKYGKIKYPILSSPCGRIHRPEYRIWMSMRQRCNNPKNKAYKNYGGRGIKICDRWDGKGGFDNFIKDMGDTNGLTLDRIDVNGDYCPENCRWATRHEQNINKRNNSPHPCVFEDRGRFGVKVRVAGKTIRKVGFSTQTEAEAVLNQIRQEYRLCS